jgi:hypothetical protein
MIIPDEAASHIDFRVLIKVLFKKGDLDGLSRWSEKLIAAAFAIQFEGLSGSQINRECCLRLRPRRGVGYQVESDDVVHIEQVHIVIRLMEFGNRGHSLRLLPAHDSPPHPELLPNSRISGKWLRDA